ncbi:MULTISPECIES: DUF2621 family protein [Planomicrobium]|uniref:DUF2621 family protein n=1 Tax=Planomicrobium okeanokoites TaxID=244 RepID=A0ABV7KQA8_PLAOK|nr:MULTISPECIES: DUF2621 family protein [Planomicrobium]PKH08289.1 DUF2621 domain-containing protein [Planomicrobium sp. MB-3u-38]TAA71060.1 DUF2621 family protein [Planomicrobium okeanokoites]
MALEGWFLWFILFWVVVLVGLFAIGGYFMFRKFLKSIPKKDGLSDLNWEEYYVGKTIHLWGDREKELLNELVQPVPDLFRPVAKQKIAGRIGQILLEEKVSKMEHEHIIRGYIQATPKRDHKFLRKKLDELNIDVAPYENYFEK